MSYSQFNLRRLRVVRRGIAVYDQKFHLGINIIRGENGSGKSTIADFIFFVLGGEFDNWKTVPGSCDQVQAEVETLGGVLSLRRDIERAQSPMEVFFGPMDEAQQHGMDGWQSYPLRRSDGRESFSQILFRASGIPEARSQGAANITMNQILRLLYSDQRTPAAFLFRYEPFDRREIREAVGDLVCGLSVYELYETELTLREVDKKFDEKDRRLSALLDAMPPDEALARPETIDSRLKDLDRESDKLSLEIENAAEMVEEGEVKAFTTARKNASGIIRKLADEIGELEQMFHVNELEIADLAAFLEYLQDLAKRLPRAESSADIIGNIEFTHCPACLSELKHGDDPSYCVLCDSKVDPERERSRYLQIKLDLDIQIRESRQLEDEKSHIAQQIHADLRRKRRVHQEHLSDYSVKYELSTSPRESFVAQRYQRLGQIDGELAALEKLRERAKQIEELSAEKAELQSEINRLKDRLKVLESASKTRRMKALTRVSDTAKFLLKRDLDRQDEFRNAKTVTVNFGDNSVLVDGELNFAESSNVIVKNSAMLSLLLAATEDAEFYHPRFALFDNIEDKGMTPDRSHNFQKLLVNSSKEASLAHQIIFTTSMINPDLDAENLVVGPYYTHEHRTLELQGVDEAG